MKEFKLFHPDFHKHLHDYQLYLILNHDQPVRIEEFVSWWVKRPRIRPDGSPLLHAARKRNPSHARQIYQQLVKKYGLFPGGQ